MLQYTGVLKKKSDTTQVSEKFKKREFVLTDNAASYPQFIMFQLTQDRCGLLDNVAEGETITVMFNLKGREWTDTKTNVIKYFNSLDVMKIESQKKGESAPTATADKNAELPF